MAKHLYHYLIKNDYIDENDLIAQEYHDVVKKGGLAELPADLPRIKMKFLD